MLEISRITLVLMIEGLILFASTTVLLAALAIVRRRRKARAVAQLADQIRHQSSLRREQTDSYLKAIYQLEDEELHAAVDTIDRQERRFFQYLIDVIFHEDEERITSIDAALAELIDTYKNMRPREGARDEAEKAVLAENEALKQSNEKLRDELAITKETMSTMVAEFGNLFGGGADHELAKHEVVEKISDTYELGDSEDPDDKEESAA